MIISTIIFVLIAGLIGSPYIFLGENFNLLAQLPVKKISEVNPLESLGRATTPLDAIWKALGSKLNIQSLDDIKNLGSSAGPLKSSLEGRFTADETSMGQAFGIVKSGLILVANILIAVLEIVLWILRGLLGLFT